METRKNFASFLDEAADSSQNLHMTHQDEDLYERGTKGALFAIKMMRAVHDTLATHIKSAKNITVKWDGAPAVFAGYDPVDGKFFVGSKAVFTKNPKLNKTHEDINANHQGGLADKLHVAMDWLPKVGIPKGTVLQGDMMFTKGDLKFETIEKERYITFHPNTIVYAVPKDTDLGRQLTQAKMGIIWHTTYTGGATLDTYTASFGADVSKLKDITQVWQEDAFFKDESGTATFTGAETKELEHWITMAERSMANFDKIIKVMDQIPSGAIGAHVKTFINSHIRNDILPNPKTATKDYIKYVSDYWDRQVIAKVKTDKAKNTKRAALHQLTAELNKIKRELTASFMYVDAITKAKLLVIKKLNTLSNMKTFIKKKNGDWEVTNHEGFVAISHLDGAAVKLVDRLEFSKNNFSAEVLKGWEK